MEDDDDDEYDDEDDNDDDDDNDDGDSDGIVEYRWGDYVCVWEWMPLPPNPVYWNGDSGLHVHRWLCGGGKVGRLAVVGE